MFIPHVQKIFHIYHSYVLHCYTGYLFMNAVFIAILHAVTNKFNKLLCKNKTARYVLTCNLIAIQWWNIYFMTMVQGYI